MNANLKKYLPFILLGVGLLVMGGVFFAVRGNRSTNTESSEETGLMEVPLNKRPIIALTPDEVGHYLKLHIEKINIEGANTMEYLLEYQVPDAPSQGANGEVEIKGKTSFDADLLLGSESSGKFRYDEGVETGAITVSFRNDAGKLITRFKSEFHLQENPSELTSIDGDLTVKLAKTGDGFFVTMPSIGTPKDISGEPKSGPYVIHSSNGDQFSGTATIDDATVYHFEDGDWKKLDGASKDLGFFYGGAD